MMTEYTQAQASGTLISSLLVDDYALLTTTVSEKITSTHELSACNKEELANSDSS